MGAWVPGVYAKAHCASICLSKSSTSPVVDTGLRQNTFSHSGLLQEPQVPMWLVGDGFRLLIPANPTVTTRLDRCMYIHELNYDYDN